MEFRGVSLPFKWCNACSAINLETVKGLRAFGEPIIMHNCTNMNVCIMAEQAKKRYEEEGEE